LDAAIWIHNRHPAPAPAPAPVAPTLNQYGYSQADWEAFSPEARSFIERPETANLGRGTDTRDFLGDDIQINKQIGQTGDSWSGKTTTYQAYDAYGIPIDDKAVYKQAIGSIRSRQALENALQKVSVQAQVSYPALAQYFQQGLTTKEALATYIGIKAKLFEVPENSVKIDEMYPVFKGKELMTPQEWEDFLYTTPEFKKTRTYMAQRTSDAKTLIRNFIPGGI